MENKKSQEDMERCFKAIKAKWNDYNPIEKGIIAKLVVGALHEAEFCEIMDSPAYEADEEDTDELLKVSIATWSTLRDIMEEFEVKNEENKVRTLQECFNHTDAKRAMDYTGSNKTNEYKVSLNAKLRCITFNDDGSLDAHLEIVQTPVK